MPTTKCPHWATYPSSGAAGEPPPAPSTAVVAGVVATRPKTAPIRAKPVRYAPRAAAAAAPTTPVAPTPARMPRPALPLKVAVSPGPAARVASAAKAAVGAITAVAAVAQPAKAVLRPQLVRLRPEPKLFLF